MHSLLSGLNEVMKNPQEDTIFQIFNRDGYIRFNMLYTSPLALKHLKSKLEQYGLQSWYFNDNELVFVLDNMTVIFKGSLSLTAEEHIFTLELDFDPVISDDHGLEFLCDIETFLKKCDSIFFMTYFVCIDTEILSHPLNASIEYLLNRK